MCFITVGSEWPSDVENRLALATVAASVLTGDPENTNKWDCVGSQYPEKEGAPKSLREMEWYMLDYVGSVNVSADNTLCKKQKQSHPDSKCKDDSAYYDKGTRGQHFYTSGPDFGKIFSMLCAITEKFIKIILNLL